MYRTKSTFLAASILALIARQPLLAGGPPWLCIPIDGVTSANSTAATEKIAAALGGKFYTEPAQFSGIKLLKNGEQSYLTLFMKQNVALGEIDAAVKNGPFSIPRKRLHLFGHVTLVVDLRGQSPTKLLADLETLKHVTVVKSESKDGVLLVTVDMPYPPEDRRGELVDWSEFERSYLSSDPATKSEPPIAAASLPTFTGFRDLVAKHEAVLQDVRWTTDYACRSVGCVATPDKQSVAANK